MLTDTDLQWIVDHGVPSGDTLGRDINHEPDQTNVLMAMIPRGGVFLDVGAHVGRYTLRAALRASWVHAVEAFPATAARLRENLAANHIANVTVYQMAAWDEPAWLTFFSENSNLVRSGSMRTLPFSGPAMPGQSVIAGAPLDNSLSQLGAIDVVKLDVEGADLRVIRGMWQTLDRCKPDIFWEDHSHLGYYEPGEAKALRERMADELGYLWAEGPRFGAGRYFIGLQPPSYFVPARPPV